MINFSSLKKESNEVYNSINRTFEIDNKDIKSLIKMAKRNTNGKFRLCSHNNRKESVHEMFIVHPKGTYVRPHKHIKKTESMIVLEGKVDYLIFNENGEVVEIIHMGDYQSGDSFYQSTSANTYHGLFIHSDWLVFLEITKGPFIIEETLYANWSPLSDNQKTGLKYIEELCLF